MATYVIDLGFNWSSAPIGSRLNSILVDPFQTTPEVSRYPLQMPLVNADTSQNAWYTDLEKGDDLIFRISDISTGLAILNPTDLSPELAVLLAAPGQDSMEEPVQPIHVPSDRTLPGGSGFKENRHVLYFDRIEYQLGVTSQVYPRSNAVWYVDPEWRPGVDPDGRKVRLVHTGTFEMSLVLKMSVAGESRYFVVDPEMIVGEHDTPPTEVAS